MNALQQNSQQYADLIYEYSSKIIEIVATMDKAEDAAQQFNCASQMLCDLDVN